MSTPTDTINQTLTVPHAQSLFVRITAAFGISQMFIKSTDEAASCQFS
jgi:hypothetical protein